MMVTARDGFIVSLSVVCALGIACAPEEDNRLTSSEERHMEAMLDVAKTEPIRTAIRYELALDGTRERLHKRLHAHLRGPVTKALLANWVKLENGALEEARARGIARARGEKPISSSGKFDNLVKAAGNDELTDRWKSLSGKIAAAEEKAFQKEKADERPVVVVWGRDEAASLVLMEMAEFMQKRFPDRKWLFKGKRPAGDGSTIAVSFQMGRADYVDSGSREVKATLVDEVRLTATGHGLDGRLAEMFSTPITASTKLSVPDRMSSDALVSVETKGFQQGLDNLELARDAMLADFKAEVDARARSAAKPVPGDASRQ